MGPKHASEPLPRPVRHGAAPGRLLGSSWGGLGRILALLVAVLRLFFSLRLGGLFGPSWRRLGPPGSLSGPSWGPLGRLRVPLGGPIGHIERMKMHFDTKIKNQALAAVRA